MEVMAIVVLSVMTGALFIYGLGRYLNWREKKNGR